MAEETVLIQAGQPVMGKGAGGKAFFLTVSKDYASVAASQSGQALGATGAKGDYLDGLLIVPGTTSAGAVSIADGGGSAIAVFTGGASSLADLKPFFVPVKAYSASGAWKVTTGANVTVLACGSFT